MEAMSVPTIIPGKLEELRRWGRAVDLIDMRTLVEDRKVHARPAPRVPLDALDPRAVMEARKKRDLQLKESVFGVLPGLPNFTAVSPTHGALQHRGESECAGGHIEGTHHIHGGTLEQRYAEVPRDRPVAVVCGSGYRASIASSFLKREGYTDVANVLGGMAAWKAAGLPTARD